MAETISKPTGPTRREVRRRAKRLFPAIVRSMSVRTLLFALVLFAVGLYGKPWKWEWLRPDEAEVIAAAFVTAQGTDAASCSMIRAAEHRPGGVFSPYLDEAGFAVDPAVGYVVRFFHRDRMDSWTVSVSPSGQIYNVFRRQPEDEPDYRIDRDEALELTLQRLATDLTLPADSFLVVKDSLINRPQRSDWIFRFSWPQALDSSGYLTATLSGRSLTGLTITRPQAAETLWSDTEPARAGRNRLLGFALIIFGVFQIILHHRTPLALRAAGSWGAVAFFLVLLVRALTFPQASILFPYQQALGSYLARMILGVIVDALQSGVLVGLIVATGEAMSRDLLPNTTTLTRIAPSQRGWIGAWVQAGRWALPFAAAVLVLEATLARILNPAGLLSKALPILAGVFSSPSAIVTAPALISLDVIWNEGLYRLWLFPLLLFWVRGYITAILVSAAFAVYFAGYDPSQLLTVGGIFYLIWGVIAGWLTLRVGIFSAVLFHLLVLAGYTGLVLMWSGVSAISGALLVVALFVVLLAIGIKGDIAARTMIVIKGGAE